MKAYTFDLREMAITVRFKLVADTNILGKVATIARVFKANYYNTFKLVLGLVD